VRVFIDDSGLLAANQASFGFSLWNGPNLLATLDEQKALVEAQISEWDGDLKELELFFNSGVEFRAASSPPSSGFRDWNQPEYAISVAHPRCQCCGVEQSETFPSEWYAVPPVLCACCVALNQVFDPALGSCVFFQSVIKIIKTWELVTTAEWLVSLIIAARTFLVSHLPKAFFECGIAVCQRSFFTHHGAHPPDNAALKQLGAVFGKGAPAS